MENANMNFWYAVNGSGQGMVFSEQPERNEARRVWMGRINSAVIRFFGWLETDCGYELPDITWKDEAVRIGMSMDIVEPEY